MTENLVAGRYQLLARIASTPRATLYRALDRETDETVAVYLVSETLKGDPRFVAHLHRQAHEAAGMNAPNVARTLDYGRDGETYFLVEQWVEGTALDRYLEMRGPLPVTDALAIADGIARALAAAHSGNLVHGGINPQSIVIRADGVVKVLQFGLSKTPGLAARPETGEGLVRARYESPEQAQGEAPTAASDVYSLGAVIFAMLAGRAPFEGATPLAVALKHVNEEPASLRELRPDVPAEVAVLVRRALAKPPATRWRNGGEMAAAIEHLPGFRPGVLPATIGTASRPSFFRRLLTWPVSLLAALALLILITTLGALLLIVASGAARQTPLPEPTAVTVPAPPVVGQTLAEAERLASSRGLWVAVSAERPDSSVPKGVVIQQTPAANEPMAPGDTVSVVVSQGAPLVEVPNLLGLDRQSARAALDRVLLKVGSETQRASGEEDRGKVLGQNPPPGARLPEDSSVDLTYGGGPAPTATHEPPTPTSIPSPTPTVPAALPTPIPASPSPSPATPSPTSTPMPVTPIPATVVPSPTVTPEPMTAVPSPTTTPPATPTAAPSPTGTPGAAPTATSGATPEISPSPAGQASRG